MDAARITTLLQPFLPDARSPMIENISTYIDMLLRWNARINLTAIREPEEIVTRHFGESLFAARHLFPLDHTHAGTGAFACPASHVIDIGSGAGFPGLPIKIFAPNIRVTLIESNQKKVAFLREVIRALTLTDIDVFPGRAEDFKDSADVVILRAVERFDTVLPTAARLVMPQGRMALLIGETQRPTATILPNFQWADPLAIPNSTSRILLVGSKHQPDKDST